MKYTPGPESNTGLPFLGDFATREHILPGGARLAATTVALEPGSIVSRMDRSGPFSRQDPAVAANAGAEVRLIVNTAVISTDAQDIEIIRPGTLIRRNYLPQWATLHQTNKDRLEAIYEMTQGATTGAEIPAPGTGYEGDGPGGSAI